MFSNDDRLHIRNNYNKIYNENYHLFDTLTRIAKSFSPDYVEGNSFHIDNQPNSIATEFETKRMNLFYFSSISNFILEIGFNAGHSSLLFLLSNPTSKIQLFDLGCHSYSKPCFDYLNKLFPNRLFILWGDSTITCPQFVDMKKNIDNTNILHDNPMLIHIDGGHTKDILESDMSNMKKVANKDTIVIVDDISFHSKHMVVDLSDLITDKFITEEITQLIPPFFSNFHIICKFST
jgi:hypothetical protein